MATVMNGADAVPVPDDVPDVTLGSIRIPAQRHFAGKTDDPYEFETFSRQLKAYLSLQNRRYGLLMSASKLVF